MKLTVTATPVEAPFAPILLRGPISESFALASQFGFEGIEIHLRDPHAVNGEEIIELSQRYSMPVTTLGTGMAAGMDGLTFTDANPEIRQQAVQRVKAHIQLASRLGSAVTIGSLNGKLGSKADEADQIRKHHMACLEECCRAAADEDVSILLEPLNRYECDWLNTTDNALSLIERLGSANLKYLADTFHMNIEEVDLGASIRRAGNRLGYVHLVDSNRCGPGHGHIDFHKVLKALIDVEYDGFLSFECLPQPDVDSALRNSIDYVKKLLADL